ncbi:hypothetical protein GJ744_011731 [Endocarpon pusillum]|uniref:Major facilitator superfamily (MFS) profile domain-containing protein n=1 Tax=Endocarpon pusillum TaxID=364733 RepID=A0A8H7AG66_9EURO|nr:hypothetical protein GJ744_011731 [Endocarpon pusillum]
MADVIREAPLGQLIRWLTGNKYLKYPEEEAAFQCPKCYSNTERVDSLSSIEEEKADLDPNEAAYGKEAGDAVAREQKASALAEDADDRPDLQALQTQKTNVTVNSNVAEHDIEKMNTQTTHVPIRSSIGAQPALTRTKTREMTRAYTRERFDIEREEQSLKELHMPIVAQRNEDGDILVDWYTTDDPANPQNWSSKKKIFVGSQIFLYTFVVYAASSIYVPSQGGVMEAFGVGYEKASLGLSLYVIGYGIGPLLFSPLSEIPLFGRNMPYIVSFALFVILCVPLALVENYAGLLVLRFLVGFMGSPCLATGGATMQDMYSFLKLPYALTFWVAAAFNAPALGPVISAFAVTAKGWRWSLWEVLWASAPVFILMFVAMPETSSSNILLRRARRLRAKCGNGRLKAQSEIDQGNMKIGTVIWNSIVVPVEISIKDPAVLFTNLYTALQYGIYYSFFEVFPLVYPVMYGFNLGETSIVFVCITVACILGIVIYCSYVYWYLEPDIIKNGLRAQEHRLVPAVFASFGIPIGLFIFGWTSNPDIHWIGSVIGITTFAASGFVLFQCIFMYLPLSYPQYAASLFATNDTWRSALAAGAIIFARPLFINLGVGRGISILAGLAVGGVVGMFGLYYYGAKLRARSRFAVT